MNRQRRRGVTLVEVLLALTILTLVTGALSQGTNYLTRRLVRARHAARARNLAWKRLIQARVEPLVNGHRSGVFGAEFPGYSWNETVAPPQQSGANTAGLYSYQLNVAWQQGWETDHVSFETLLYQHPPKPKKARSSDEK
ncbi:MAG TPA: prepilin-type N-terminal cleavage/methylation domain-containing protein [Candidatus Rifleibacterium sp.]|nr:prepilin-type N-terminal cleavage/methylation domain-containing protein [Candidatus Rifleibacterium sp.]HPT44513.1 prepilin-type N-terminal cleavage/methylation domain-containing protein [Candidatus Rifleibacterium sp.]